METTTLHVTHPLENREEIIIAHIISWKAIIAGVFVTLAIISVLNLLGLGLDLLVFTPDKEQIQDITLTSLVWIILTSMFAILAGSWVAGRMAGPALYSEGALHGLITWSVTTFITFLLATYSIGAAIGLASTTIAQSQAFAEQSAPPMNQPMNNLVTSPVNNANQLPTNGMMNQTTSQAPAQGNYSTANMQLYHQNLHEFLSANTPADEAAAKEKLVTFLEQNEGLTPEQTAKIVDNWKQAKENAIVNAENASKNLGILVLILFLTFLLTAITSAFGGMWGSLSDRKLFVREIREVKKV